MDREQAIQELKKFREEYIVGRDRLLEIYSFFKFNTNEEYYTTLINNAPVKVRRNLYWDIVTSTDIRKICQKPKIVEENLLCDEQDGVLQSNTIDTTEVTKIRKDLVTYKNKLNFERNLFNKNLKEISSLEELNKELIEGIKKLKPIEVKSNSKKNNVTQNSDNDDVLLIQLSDLHCSELTNEFRSTSYDFNTASARLKKFAEIINKEIITKNINKVVIAMTGDICNSDSILSKQQNNATNKAVSVLLATKLLQYFILDIYDKCQNISIASVSGNEGRYTNMQDFYTDENLITNSPDFMIFNILKLLFESYNTIRFLNGRNAEQVININNNNILITHGVHLGKGDVGKSVQQTIARYSDKGVNIRYVVFGHLHSTKLSNYFMRSSSLVGNNSYATTMLNLNSRASQNIALISKNGDITPTAIDLENIEDIVGYDISEELKIFNVKNATKGSHDDLIQII